MSAWLRTGAARRIAVYPMALLLAGCASVFTSMQPVATMQDPVTPADVAPPPQSQLSPIPSDPANVEAIPVAPVLADITLSTVVPPEADPAPQNESVRLSLPEVPETPAAPASEASAIEVAPEAAPPQRPVTVNLPAPPASAPVKALGSMIPTAPPRSNPVPSVIAKAPEPLVDVAGLKLRLRDTRGMGVFEKLILKRELDNLLQKLRSQHEMGQKSGVALLRSPYNSLVQKVLAALREGDPDLARVILASREAIWAILSDPVIFFTAN